MEPLSPRLRRVFLRAHRPGSASCVSAAVWIGTLTLEAIAIAILIWRLT